MGKKANLTKRICIFLIIFHISIDNLKQWLANDKLACVANALNLLYIVNGLDECVGRLQRRLTINVISYV